MTEPAIEAIGEDGLGVSMPSATEAARAAAHLRACGGWLEVVEGLDSLVVVFDPLREARAEAIERLRTALLGEIPPLRHGKAFLEIPVRYGGEDGPDLGDVCKRLGLTPDDFIARHTGSDHRVELIGFTPGFAYLGGLDAALAMPRRDTPRSHVPAGSIGIAGPRSGVYALDGPGGWQIVGRTPLQLVDMQASSPFRLEAGIAVRFVALDVP